MSVQQNQGIKGTVVDATGETLIGASVKVAGTTNGAVTDLDGKFTLNCKPGVTLEVSYIGYKTMTVKAANGMKITMQEDGKALNEVVVTEQSGSGESHVVGYLTYILVVVACHVADAYGQKRHFVPVVPCPS